MDGVSRLCSWGGKQVMWMGYILNKSENATLQLSIFYEKVLDKK